jgi:hypothetical protein
MLPILFLVWSVASGPVRSVANGAVPAFVLSARIFTERFDIAHAGTAMDQPGIHKWLFWFTATTVVSLPYAAAVRWLSDRSKTAGHLAYAVPTALLCIFLLCVLSWPLTWLIQYVHSMGFTPRRAYGLAYAGAGGFLVIGFLCWSVRRQRVGAETSEHPKPGEPTEAR